MKTYKLSPQNIEENKIIKYILLDEKENPISFLKAMELLSNNDSFRAYWISVLKEIPFIGYFWETPAVNKKNWDTSFEFVAIKSKYLVQLQEDRKAFSSYFNQSTPFKNVVSFMNLGKDAKLIVPCPINGQKGYPHLATFIKCSPIEQLDSFWNCIGTTMIEYVNDDWVWLSTAGLGVSWLHIRLDSRPKYYKFKPYIIP